jgi:hypothetical protein
MLTNTFKKKKNLSYKLMWHNIIRYEINLNFEKPNHVVPHQFIKVFFYIKCVCKPNIFLFIKSPSKPINNHNL